MSWVKEKLGPTIKESQSKEEVQAAKNQAKKEGTANLFEEVETVTPPKLTPKDIVQKRTTGLPKKKSDLVRSCVSLLELGSERISSINTRQPISKCRIVNSIC